MPRIALALVFAAGLIGTHALTTSADGGKPAYTPVANIKNIMNAINHEEFGLFGMMKNSCKGEKIPRSQLKMMRHQAAMLAEAGNILEQLDPPKGEAESWRTYSAAFRKAAKAMKRPIIKGKKAPIMAGLAELKKQCDACHTAHRPE